MDLQTQVEDLFLLALPIACIAWTITHEEIFREPREMCERHSALAKSLLQKKFYYVFTCEYCFSHYVTIFFLVVTKYHLLFSDWRGYLIGGFALVWIANIYMSIFGLIRTGLKKEKIEANIIEEELKTIESEEK